MTTKTPELNRSAEFTTFMRAYQDMVFTTAARLAGNDAQAQDIAQDVFLRAYENFSHLRTSPTAGGWLKTVTTNLTLNHLTRYRKRWRFFSDFKANPDAGDDLTWDMQLPLPDTLLADLSAQQRAAEIDAALQRLPDHQRLPLVLYHFEEFTYEEISARLGVSLSKLKTDIRRGRAALLPMLKSRGIDHD